MILYFVYRFKGTAANLRTFLHKLYVLLSVSLSFNP